MLAHIGLVTHEPTSALSALCTPLIEAMGSARLPAALAASLHRVAEFDRFYIFAHQHPQAPPELLAAEVPSPLQGMVEAYRRYFFRRDPLSDVLCSLGAASASLRVDAADLPLSQYRSVCFDRPDVPQRVSLIRRAGQGWLVLNLARSRMKGLFTEAELAALSGLSALLLPLVARHHALQALHGVPGLEHRLAERAPDLTARERVVCARTMVGSTATEIGAALGIGAASVLTYRQRAYRKLDISGALSLWQFLAL